jgi:hypothetical protein
MAMTVSDTFLHVFYDLLVMFLLSKHESGCHVSAKYDAPVLEPALTCPCHSPSLEKRVKRYVTVQNPSLINLGDLGSGAASCV